MADGPYDVPQIAGTYEQEREYYIRLILERFPTRSTDPALLYGDPKLEFLRLVNEGLLPDPRTEIVNLTRTVEGISAGVEKKVGQGDLVFNVLDFGAFKDKTKNSTAAFQAALNAARDVGGATVYVPSPGKGQEYRIGGRLNIYSNTKFKVEEGTVIRRWGNSFGITNMTADGSSPLSDNNDPYSGFSDIIIEGGIWDGYAPDSGQINNGYGTGFNCFVFTVSRNIVMRDVTVKNMATNHAIDINGVNGILVDNCKFFGYRDYGAEQDRGYTEAIQYSPFFEDSPTHVYASFAKYANGAASLNIEIRGCTFGASKELGSWPTGFGNHSAQNKSRGALSGNINIHDNRFEGCTFIGLTIYTYDNVKVDRNIFNGCQAGIRANNFGSGRSWNPTKMAWETAPSRQRCTNQTYSNNTFIDSKDFDIVLQGTGVSANDGTWDVIDKVKVINNTRVRTLAGRSTGQAIRLLLCNSVEVSGNTVGKASVGISIEACVDVVVLNNNVDDTAGYGILLADNGVPASEPAGYTTDALVSNNTVRNTGTHGIGINGTNRFSAIGNTVLNHSRIGAGTGLIMSSSSNGVVSGNRIICTSSPNSSNGISVYSGTNIKTTFDNFVDGVTTKLAGLNNATLGNVYGPLSY